MARVGWIAWAWLAGCTKALAPEETARVEESAAPTESTVPEADADGDGSADAEDCAPEDAAVHPGAPELPYDGVDNDCDPSTPDDDLDGDGYGVADDCRDRDFDVNPGAAEVCDRVDNDCDGRVDDGDDDVSAPTWYRDRDGDGYGTELLGTRCWRTGAAAALEGDCDDEDPAMSPGEAEVCDGLDNDCDGGIDDGVKDSADCPWEEVLWRSSAVFWGDTERYYMGEYLALGGDLLGDGGADVVIAGGARKCPTPDSSGCAGRVDIGGHLWVFSGTRRGEILATSADATITAPTIEDATVPLSPVVADFNGDGQADLLFGTEDGLVSSEGAARVYYGPLSGSYSTREPDAMVYGETLADQIGQQNAAYTDAEGGVMALVASDSLEARNRGGGAYLLEAPIVGIENALDVGHLLHGTGISQHVGSSAAMGDLNGDGVGDAVLGAYRLDAIFVMYGPIVTDLALPLDADATITGGYQVGRPDQMGVVDDYDGDGIDDLWSVTAYVNPNVAVVYGPTYGTVSLRDAPVVVHAGTNVTHLVGADVTGDGWTDLVVSLAEFDEPVTSMRIMPGPTEGHTDGTAGGHAYRWLTGGGPTGSAMRRLAAGDVDGDGWVDLLGGSDYNEERGYYAGAGVLMLGPFP